MPNGNLHRPIWIDNKTILDRRTWVYYLTIVKAAVNEWSKVIEVQPDEAFYKLVAKYAKAYIEDGKQPPEMIASAIVNIADDMISGRDVTLRTGDYIAIQNFMRQGKKGK